jgi:hypothetical protein
MKKGLAISLAIVSRLAVTDAAAGIERGPVVHEWGTFTSIAGDDGSALEWRPLEQGRDLPSFVYDISRGWTGLRDRPLGKGELKGTVRMETPVLYFYTDRELDVSARVGFPEGRITEWYPAAHDLGGGIDWGRFHLLPDAKLELRTESAPSHYYPARATDAAIVRLCTDRGPEYEKFLFYRGVGSFALPIAATLDGDRIHLVNTHQDAIGTVIVFDNRAGKIGVSVIDRLGHEATIARPKASASLDQALSALERVLRAQGLYEKESQAMLATWRDSWFEDGLRVFYVLPRAETDRVLPLSIDPQPAELVRVLVGRTEILTPERQARIADLARKLADASPSARRDALAALEHEGRFARPILERMHFDPSALIGSR